MSQERLIDYERLATPGGHLETLVEPAIPKLIEYVQGYVAAGGATDGLRPARRPEATKAWHTLRESLRGRLELGGPAVMTGHQCEFFHAGVFAKTIAAALLAERLGGTAVFLAVDSDLPKTGEASTPYAEGGEVRTAPLPLPGCDVRRLVEDHAPATGEQWSALFAEARRRLGAGDDVLDEFARGVGSDETLCDVILRGQRQVMEELGLAAPKTLRVSNVSETPEFRAFAGHIALNAERFARCYNEAQVAYRRRRRVRNSHRPAPALQIDGERIELPFWVYRAGERRGRLFAVRDGGRTALYAELELAGRVEAGDEGEVSAAIAFEDERWRLRPRALALTAFVRLLLCDAFIHGIGGAKYDEMMEDFARAFFGVEPAPACCVTATARLELPSDGVGRGEVRAAERAVRDVHFNPQRYIRGIPVELLKRREALIRRSEELRGSQGAERREVFKEIRGVNEAMRRVDPGCITGLTAAAERAAARHESNLRALDREYFFGLHSRETLGRLAGDLRDKIVGV